MVPLSCVGYIVVALWFVEADVMIDVAPFAAKEKVTVSRRRFRLIVVPHVSTKLT